MNPIKLLIVADDPLARAGLALLLSDVPDCQVIGQVGSDALETGLEEEPDAIIWDLGWEEKEEFPDWQAIGRPVLVLLADGADATAAWSAGAQALLNRELDAEKLVAAAQTAVRGLLVLDPDLAQTLLPDFPALDAPLVEALTPRENEVLQLLAEGVTNKAIAQRLAISDHTVKFHVNAIMSKLGAQSRTEAVVRATRLGLIIL